MKHAVRVAVVGCLATIALALLATPARADWRSLTGPFPANTNFFTYNVSPDSRYVAYVADAETDGTYELFVVALAGGAPRKLNPPLPPNGDVVLLLIAFTFDSQSVLYLADQEVDGRLELYRVPVTGGPSVKLSAPLVAGGNVVHYLLDPDGQRIVYLADQEIEDVDELWSIPYGGGAATKLNGPLASGGDVSTHYGIDPIGNRVVYLADQLLDQRTELFSVPISGGTSVRLNPELTATGEVLSFELNRVSNVVVFPAQESGASTDNLWVASTGGFLSPSKLNFNLPVNDHIIGYAISPIGDKVVYNVATSNDVNYRGYAYFGNLYSTPIGGGGGSVGLTETAEPYFSVNEFRFTPNGSHVVYEYQKNATSAKRLKLSTVQFGVRAALYKPLSGDPPPYSYVISADNARVAYTAGSDEELQRLYTIPIGGGTPTSFGPGRNALLTLDHSRVVFSRTTGADSHSDLFSAKILGGDERNLSGLQGSGSAFDAQLSPDGTAIVFAVWKDGRYELRLSDGRAAQPPGSPTSPAPPQPGGHRTLLPLAQR